MFPTSQQQQQFAAPQPQVYGNPTFTPTFAQPTNQFPPPTSPQQFFPPQQSFSPQQQYTNPQQPIRPEWTGAGFGGYTPSTASTPVNIMPTISSAPPSQPQFQQPPVQNTVGLQADRNSTGTNPFRASMLPNVSSSFPQTDHGTNPFQQRSQTMPPTLSHPQSFSNQTSFAPPQPQSTFQPFSTPSQPTFQPSTFQPQQSVFQQSSQPQPVFTQQQAQPAPVQVSASTGTNPFSRPQLQATQQARLTPQVTGSNPFRQSVMPGGASTSTTTGVPNGFGWSQ